MKPHKFNITETDFLEIEIIDQTPVLSIINGLDLEERRSIPIRLEEIELFCDSLTLAKDLILSEVSGNNHNDHGNPITGQS